MCYQLFLLPRRAPCYVLLGYDIVFWSCCSCVLVFRKNIAPQNLVLHTLKMKTLKLEVRQTKRQYHHSEHWSKNFLCHKKPKMLTTYNSRIFEFTVLNTKHIGSEVALYSI